MTTVESWVVQDRSPNVQSFAFGLNVLLLFVTVICQIAMIYRRRRFPLHGRSLVISSFLAFAFFWVESLTLAKQFSEHCVILYFLSASKHMGALPITMEAWHLLMRRKIQTNIEEMKLEAARPRIQVRESWFLRNIWLIKEPFLVIILSLWNLWNLGLPFIARFYFGRFDCPREPAFNFFYYIANAQSLLVLVLNMVFAYLLKNEPDDAFLLRQDLIAISWMGVFVMVLAVGTFRFVPTLYAYWRFDEIIATVSIGFITWRYLVHPLYRSFNSPDPKKGVISHSEGADFRRILTTDFANFYAHMRGELAVEELKLWQLLSTFFQETEKPDLNPHEIASLKKAYFMTIYSQFIEPNRISIPWHVRNKFSEARDKETEMDAAVQLAQREIFSQLFREHYHRYQADALVPAKAEKTSQGGQSTQSRTVVDIKQSVSFKEADELEVSQHSFYQSWMKPPKSYSKTEVLKFLFKVFLLGLTVIVVLYFMFTSST